MDSEPLSSTIGSSTEVLSTSTFGTNPSSLTFDSYSSNIPKLIQFQLEDIPLSTSNHLPPACYSPPKQASLSGAYSPQSCMAQTMTYPPRPSLSTSTSPSSKLSGVCVPSLLVTVPVDQTPPAILSLNLAPVHMPNQCIDPSIPTIVDSSSVEVGHSIVMSIPIVMHLCP